jgi:hypothetical protein
MMTFGHDLLIFVLLAVIGLLALADWFTPGDGL